MILRNRSAGGGYVQVKAADGKVIKPKGVLFANIWLNDQHFVNIELHVLKNCPYAMILGQFLKYFSEIILNFKDKQINVMNQKVHINYELN